MHILETSPLAAAAASDRASPGSPSAADDDERGLSGASSRSQLPSSTSPAPFNYGTLPPPKPSSQSPSPSQPPPPPPRTPTMTFLHDNRGLFLFALAQLFGGIMGMFTRFLATSLPSGQKYHALQILFVRMSITCVCCLAWMWWNNVPHMPLGQRGIRGLLAMRGAAGFVGVFGLYYSLSYLPLPDATVITFLVPTVLSLICSLIPSLNEPFTTHEKIGGAISLLGVTLIARPTFLFPHPHPAADPTSPLPPTFSNSTTTTPLTIPSVLPPPVSPHQRTLAVVVALVGVLGAASAYTTIRVIGHRAHPLISVTYFAALTTILSLTGILAIPSVGGMLIPQDALEWALLAAIGVSGFLLQFLLTKGLQLEKAGRAGSLVYTQMVWAVVFEWAVWGGSIGGWSLLGAGLVLGGAAWVNWQKWRGAGAAVVVGAAAGAGAEGREGGEGGQGGRRKSVECEEGEVLMGAGEISEEEEEEEEEREAPRAGRL